jgi:Ca-activated chloride channel family protein
MPSRGPSLTIFGWLVILAFIGGCGYAAFYFLQKKPLLASHETQASQPTAATSGDKVEIGIAYGTEKQRWLQWAAGEFAKTPEGQGIRINLIPFGSVEGAQAIVGGDQRIDVWSPASALYKDVFVQDWTFKYNKPPILREEALALTPMVFVMWAERYDAFIAKYGKVDFQTIEEATAAPGGWDAIAGKPEWGLFKFSHTHPNQSNSGLMTLVLLAYDFAKKNHGLTLKDILNPDFQKWMLAIENGVGTLSNSTGNLMRDMVLRGPSTYDCVFVYENVVIDYLKNAEGRWGSLRVVYPATNMWNENPYYVLDVPWGSDARRKAANAFLDYLLSEPVQREALKHGFRPGNPDVPVKFPESPFVTFASAGLSIDIGTVCEPPRAEIITNLLETWQRGRGSR